MNPIKENPTWGTGGAEELTACAIRDTRPIIHTLGFLLYCFAGAKHTQRAVANPTVSGVLSCPEFRGLQICRYQLPQNFEEVIPSFGRGVSVRKAGGMISSMLRTPRLSHTHIHGLTCPCRLLIEFLPRDERKRDIDNMLASIKAGLDGCPQAVGVDDSIFNDCQLVKHKQVGGMVRLSVLPASCNAGGTP